MRNIKASLRYYAGSFWMIIPALQKVCIDHKTSNDLAGQAKNAEKKSWNAIAQESREAGSLMGEHQGIFGEQRPKK